MADRIICLTITGLLAAAVAVEPVWGSGYRIPEQSINSVGMAGGYIASASGPDASYNNPANMSWNKDAWQIETSISYINLKGTDYTDYLTPVFNGSSASENYVLPLLHLVSEDISNFRFGFSLTYPYGLSKRWDEPFPTATAREFDLKVYEGNPSVSYRFNDHLSAAVGVRLLYAEGKVQSSAVNPPISGIAPLSLLARDMEGDATEWGYNLALSYRPLKSWNISATYRSQVDLDVEGDAALIARHPLAGLVAWYDGDAGVEVVTPAVLTISTAYTLKQATVTLTWDRTYWSEYDQLDFDYEQSFTGNPYFRNFDSPVSKNWEDTDAFRIGFSYANTERLTTMMGIAFDENPVPESTLGFELPDSDAVIYSIGFRYKTSDNIEIGLAYLYDDKEERKVENSLISGEFDGAGAHIVNAGLLYTF